MRSPIGYHILKHFGRILLPNWLYFESLEAPETMQSLFWRGVHLQKSRPSGVSLREKVAAKSAEASSGGARLISPPHVPPSFG